MEHNLPQPQVVTVPAAQASGTPTWSEPTSVAAPAETGSNSQPLIDKKKIMIFGSLIFLILAVVTAGYYFLNKQQAAQKPRALEPPKPQVVSNASFFLTSEPAESSVGGQIRVTVWAKTGGEKANLFVAKLKFPKDLLKAENIDLKPPGQSSFIKDWFISNWVENTFNNDVGSASLVGGVPNPGFQTLKESSGSAMVDVVFTAREKGEAELKFDDTSAIYRNSDSANILTSKKSLTLTISGEATPTATPTTTKIKPTTSPKPTSTPSATLSPSPTPAGPKEGDINLDDEVDLEDLSILMSEWGETGLNIGPADLNKDKVINSFDYGKMVNILITLGVITGENQ